MDKRWTLLLMLWVSACATTAPGPTMAPADAANIAWPAAPEQARIAYVRTFSEAKDLGLRSSFASRIRDFFAGGDQRRMTRPYSVTVNDDLIVVADPGLAVVHVFDTSRKSYRMLDRAGDTRFESPISVKLGDDRLFIADSKLNKVFVLDRRFKLIFVIENFARPTGLAFDPLRKNLYVADTLAHQVKAFDASGKLVFKIGTRGDQDGQFNFPSHLAFAAERLLVNDTMNFRIQVFDADGNHLKTFGKHGNSSGNFTQPKGVAMDSEGHIYVADAMSNRVQIFDPDGTFLLGFGRSGDGPGGFQMPAGLTIWNDMIYIADSYNRRVQVFHYLKEDI